MEEPRGERAAHKAASRGRSVVFDERRRTRRGWLHTVLGLGGMSAAMSCSVQADGPPEFCRGDVPVDETTALLYSAKAPLVPPSGQRDSRAVWTRVPRRPDRSVLLYLHGHNGYVTVDAAGRSRVPDWAAGDQAARAGASAKEAAPLVYKLDRLGSGDADRRPVVLVPEVSTLATGAFWAREPAGQYAEPTRLGALVADCLDHLACLRRPDGGPYLPAAFARPALDRIYLGGHSGAGLPLEEAAASELILPGTGVPADLWLFDCTYWSAVARFVRFCERWSQAGRLAGGRGEASRFVCIYHRQGQTEEVADALRGEVARALGVAAASLVKDHSPGNFETDIRPAMQGSGVLFLRTHLPHNEIPTFFIPELLRTAAT